MKESRYVSEHVQRQLYSECMGRCMNPDCMTNLFRDSGDIIEKAHLDPFYKAPDNSFENMVVLCPNCHTDYDKNAVFTLETVKMWKQLRKQAVDKIFAEKYASFAELRAQVAPLLFENKTIYENYYLGDQKALWDKFEPKILVNNRKLKKILENNLVLFQSHTEESYSNLASVLSFLMHIDEFEATRLPGEKSRCVLFPEEINSIFGICSVKDSFLPSVESLEALITALQKDGKFIGIFLGNDEPYIELEEEGKPVKIFLDDTPRLRQIYYDYRCFRTTIVRLQSLNFALKYIKSRNVPFEFAARNNLREVLINNVKIIFIYEYCLSKVELIRLSPEAGSVVVNLHNWNGEYCISKEANDFATTLDVTLLCMDDFYGYINELRRTR